MREYLISSVVAVLLALAARATCAAQAPTRDALLLEIKALKQQLVNTTDPAEQALLNAELYQKELLFLEPADSDRAAFPALRNRVNAGVIRLMPRENFEGVLNTRGGGAYYSFARQDHPYGYGSDLSLEGGALRVGFAGADFGFMTMLGDLPVESVTADTPGAAALANFTPPLDEPGARQQQQRAQTGFQDGNFLYVNRAAPLLGKTFALRSVNYESSDLLVVFRPYRIDSDLSLILAWKLLKRYPTPQLGTGQSAGGTLATVSAASYAPSNFAKDTIAAAFGKNFADKTYLATALPLPLQLGGAYVSIQDSSDRGYQQYAPLFAVTPNQVNYLIPPETAVGFALVTVRSASGVSSTELIRITGTAPGLFTANADGAGAPAAVLLRIRGAQQSYEAVARFDAAQNKYVPAQIDVGQGDDQVFLLLYGTGIRRVSSLQNVSVKIGDTVISPTYAGAQGGQGLDQINVPLPASLVGKGEVDLTLTVDGIAANVVRVNIR
jgi:uncharacterized protein (TIGR03437 family)